jgi:rSAM/selenodomain-associated transferase 1
MDMRRGKFDPVAVAILAKAPIPGRVKTRLIPALGADGAAALQARFIARAVDTATSADIGPVTLWATPDQNHPAFQECRAKGLALARQPDADLGARMCAALAQAAGPALVIGTDCPALTPAHLRTAAAVLRDGIDVAIVPVEDGGYAVIGARRAEPRLFEAMSWGTADVMAQTRRVMAQLGLSWREPARLWDVDRPQDLARLDAEFAGPVSASRRSP